MARRFPAPWTAEQIPGGFKVVDATGQSLAYVCASETNVRADAARCSPCTRQGAWPTHQSPNCRNYLETNGALWFEARALLL
jgi:hypothetical protein